MTHGLALFYQSTPDDKDLLVDFEQPIRKPRPQLVCQPRVQSPSGWVNSR
jgi:hypothetical protein